MVNKSVEKAISLFLLIGTPFATLFLSAEPLPFAIPVTDPVNVTKLFAAGMVGFGVFAIAAVYGFKQMWQTSKLLVISSVLFVLGMVNAAFASSSPMVQNLYGVYGRQTGLICYLILVFTALAATLLRRKRSFEYVIWALIAAGIVNTIYSGYAHVFGDFVGWNNPYGNILGLFGNPDFISAFLGMFIAGVFGYAFSKHIYWPYRIPIVLFLLVPLWEIKVSHAIQGLVVTGAGLAVVGFYLIRALGNYLKSKPISIALQSLYVTVMGIIGGFALAGALQHGPLTSLIYKRSVSLRGQYWNSGIVMGQDHPWTGVGMDAIGDWYRRTRSELAATTTPGAKTVINATHNVIIDMFANGGFPLLLSYLAMIGIGLWAIIRVTLRQPSYDGIFVAMVATWAGYILQSIVSINQIGLAIWGWILLGAIVGYEFTTRPSKEPVLEPAQGKKVRTAKKQKELIFSPQLVGGIGVVIGALVAVPPFAADAKWRSALNSQNLQKVEAALNSTYLTPMDSSRLAQAVILFENSKLPDLAYKYAKIGVDFNPQSFDAWRVLYAATQSTPEDKQLALAKMKELDPRNPDVLAQ